MEQHGILYISVHEAAPAQTIHMSIGSPIGGLVDRDMEGGVLPYKTLAESDGTARAWLGALRSDRSYVRVRVVDSGCGMNEKTIEHIFEPFYTTKSVDRGTGLGLSSVHGLLAAHKGALALHSRAGKGTTFDIFLPAAAGDAALKPVPTGTSRLMGHGRILIVEDDPNVRTMIELMIKRLGYEALSCDHGLSAIDAVREEAGDFDLIVSDYMMPDMTGADMAEQIAPDFPKLPMLILSGYSKDKMEEIMAAHPSIRAVMSKPVDSATLSQKIRAIMEDRKH
jgi:CheY-like chemotaxis protein